MPLLPVVLVSAQLVLTAHELPQFNVEPSCRAAAMAGASERQNLDACLNDERRARGKLQQRWSAFSAAERARCVQLTRLGGQPSYVELLTCLQIAKDAGSVPDDNAGIGLIQ